MTTSTASSAARPSGIKLSDPSQLLAAVPQLLGFRPVNSVVLIGHREPRGGQIGLVIRGDLPADVPTRPQVEHLVALMAGTTDVGATIVVVGRHPGRAEPERIPHADFVEMVTEVLVDARFTVVHSMWVPEISSGARWKCYSDLACGGILPDVGSTVAAAVMAGAGVVTYDSREEMARVLDPVDDATIARRAARLADLPDASDPLVDAADATSRGCAAVWDALRQAERHDFQPTDDQAVTLAVALGNPRVRDACLATAVPPASPDAHHAERLWLALVRGLPAPERAEAACLLGYAAYVRGEGALAGMAFDNALEAAPRHVLAGLLNRALQYGLDPKRLYGLAKLDGVIDLAKGAAA